MDAGGEKWTNYCSDIFDITTLSVSFSFNQDMTMNGARLHEEIFCYKPFRFLLLFAAVGWTQFAICPEIEGKHGLLITNQHDVTSSCQISGPMGPWDHYQTRDLPHGVCSGAQPCTIWTKDSCPGTTYPGPAIKWKCVCDSGAWRCDEQERTKTTCINK